MKNKDVINNKKEKVIDNKENITKKKCECEDSKVNTNSKSKSKSLYSYIILVFLVILLIMFLVTSVYFRYARMYLLDMIEEQSLNVNITLDRSLFEQIISGVIETIALSSIIGILLVIVVAKHIIKPLKEVTDATKKVAKGDFTVNLETNRVDEIGELTKNFNKMVKELNNMEYLSKEFISNVSHEFKTPIASIQGFAKLLKEDNLTDEEKTEYMDIIIEESDRLTNLANNIQSLSKIENKEILSTDQEILVDEQIRKCIVILNQKLEDKNIDISLEGENIKLFGNEDLLQQVWINLINNAIKYTNENGKIEINIEDGKNFVNIEIKDNGIGVEKEKQERIFEKFYQADPSRGTEGNGLGLAIVKKIIDLHEGKISLESEVGKGSTFKVMLPKNEKI